jgi:hypothetical protein
MTISFIKYIKCLKSNNKTLRKNTDDNNSPESFFFSNNPSLNVHSFSSNILKYKYFPLPIPSILNKLKLNYEKKMNKNFDSINIEYYDKTYPNYWANNFNDDVFILFIVTDGSKCYIEYKNNKKIYKKEIFNLEYIIKKKKTNKDYVHRVLVNGEVYVLYMYDYNSITKQDNFSYYKLDDNDRIYMSNRWKYCKQIKEYFKIMKYFNSNEKNFDTILSKLKEHQIELDNNIGNGTWGEVYKIKIDKYYKIALKISKIDKKDIAFVQNNQINRNNIKWHEQLLFKDIIDKNPHPNIPLCVDTLQVHDHHFNNLRQNDRDKCPALITIMELCDCDLHSYLLSFKDEKMSNQIFLSIFFQICSAIHHMQMLSQNLNRDIKPSNILCIRCNPGGVWEYNIQNKKYYVPNTGIICLLTDFGVSRTYNPELKLSYNDSSNMNTGMRYAIHDDKNSKMLPFISKNKKDNIIRWKNNQYSMKIIPIFNKKTEHYSNLKKYDIDLSKTQTEILKKSNIDFIKNDSHFTNNPYVIPPLNFLYDIQDVCKMFCNYKTNRCLNRKNTKRVCHDDLCNDCKSIDKQKQIENINKCKKCSYICDKCILSKRNFQNSFHTIYKCFDHIYIRNFLNDLILNEMTVYPIHSRFYLMAKTIEYLFSTIYNNKNDTVIETYHI